MIIDKKEALHIIILAAAHLKQQNFVYKPVAEDLVEIGLIRRIAREFPELKTRVEYTFKELGIPNA